MDILATFPELTFDRHPAPTAEPPPPRPEPAIAGAEAPRPKPAASRAVRPRLRLPSWSVTVLSLVAAAVWVAVWVAERTRGAASPAGQATVARETPHETLTR